MGEAEYERGSRSCASAIPFLLTSNNATIATIRARRLDSHARSHCDEVEHFELTR